MRSYPSRTRPGVLGERDFALLFIGYGVSLTGSGMIPVALAFGILGQGHEAVTASLEGTSV